MQDLERKKFFVGKNIARLRKLKGWSQAKLEQESTVKRGAIAQIELGNNNPSPENAALLAKALGVTIEELETNTEDYKILQNLTSQEVEVIMTTDSKSYVPFYDIDITAGNFNVYPEFSEAPTGYIYAPEFAGCIACKVRGDSMYKRIMPGATVFVQHQESKKYIDYGQIYLLILDGLRPVKYVFPHEDEDRILLVSENQEKYPSWSVERSDVLHLFLVKGYINQNAN